MTVVIMSKSIFNEFQNSIKLDHITPLLIPFWHSIACVCPSDRFPSRLVKYLNMLFDSLFLKENILLRLELYYPHELLI